MLLSRLLKKWRSTPFFWLLRLQLSCPGSHAFERTCALTCVPWAVTRIPTLHTLHSLSTFRPFQRHITTPHRITRTSLTKTPKLRRDLGSSNSSLTMALTCDPKDPRSPEWLKRICRNLRWIPFGFILALIAYAYLTVTISLALRYNLARKGEWGSALLELLLSSVLAGGAIWGFLVAVFKDPGSPLDRSRDHESRGALESASEYGLGEENDEGQSLIRGQEETHAEHESARAPLLNAPIPGQPQYPARSGRQQLDDLQRLRSQVSTSADVKHRSNIWVKSSGESRWCNKCDAPKPDRTHHCSTCKR